MKKLYFLFVVLLMNILSIYAQPNLTFATHGIVPGDVYSYFYGDTTNFNIGASGANVTWTDTGWNIGTMLVTVNYLDPATTPFKSSFPNATYAVDNDGTYTYYKTLSTGSLPGIYTEGIADSNKSVVYRDNEKKYPYPFTYPTTSMDYFSGTDTIIGNRFPTNGQITTTADGWGKLIINGRTYNNVLRVKFYEERSDYTIKMSPVDTLVAIHYKTTTYHWYTSNNKNPIINYSEMKVYLGHNTVPDKIDKEIFVDHSVTGINDNHSELLSFTVYPNPGKGIVNLESNISNPQKLIIEILNTNGQVVYKDAINTSAGLMNHAIDVSTLPQGIYNVKVFNNQTVGMRKLIIQ